MSVQGNPPATAFIGGGGRGIGRAIACALAAEGFEVFVAARTATELDELREQLRGKGVPCHTRVTDLSDPSEAASAIGEAHHVMGSLGVLVSSVGAHPETHPVEDYPIDYWRMMLEVNLGSVFYAARAAAPHMKNQRSGRIINIASVASKIGPPNSAAYVAAKHGVAGLTKVLASELGPHGITANAICPGFVATRMTAHKDRLREFCITRAPIGRIVDEREVAALAVHLAGPYGGAITGQALSVCGGLSM
jgi:NAD(P)-dependent dehydrogenase (short-subunit alcohol dehydrogenase family)